MPKIPRDISGKDLVRALGRLGYGVVRQSGSHIRLAAVRKGVLHAMTIPAHDPIKIGTLNAILNDLSGRLEISKEELIARLFG